MNNITNNSIKSFYYEPFLTSSENMKKEVQEEAVLTDSYHSSIIPEVLITEGEEEPPAKRSKLDVQRQTEPTEKTSLEKVKYFQNKLFEIGSIKPGKITDPNTAMKFLFNIGFKGKKIPSIINLPDTFGGINPLRTAELKFKVGALALKPDPLKTIDQQKELFRICQHRDNFLNYFYLFSKPRLDKDYSIIVNDLISNINELDNPDSNRVNHLDDGSTSFTIPGGNLGVDTESETEAKFESHFTTFEFAKKKNAYLFITHNRGEGSEDIRLHEPIDFPDPTGKIYAKTSVAIEVSKDALQNPSFLLNLITARVEHFIPISCLYDAIYHHLIKMSHGKIVKTENEDLLKQLYIQSQHPLLDPSSQNESKKIALSLIHFDPYFHSTQLYGSCTESNFTPTEKLLASRSVHRKLKKDLLLHLLPQTQEDKQNTNWKNILKPHERIEEIQAKIDCKNDPKDPIYYPQHFSKAQQVLKNNEDKINQSIKQLDYKKFVNILAQECGKLIDPKTIKDFHTNKLAEMKHSIFIDIIEKLDRNSDLFNHLETNLKHLKEYNNYIRTKSNNFLEDGFSYDSYKIYQCIKDLDYQIETMWDIIKSDGPDEKPFVEIADECDKLLDHLKCIGKENDSILLTHHISLTYSKLKELLIHFKPTLFTKMVSVKLDWLNYATFNCKLVENKIILKQFLDKQPNSPHIKKVKNELDRMNTIQMKKLSATYSFSQLVNCVFNALGNSDVRSTEIQRAKSLCQDFSKCMDLLLTDFKETNNEENEAVPTLIKTSFAFILEQIDTTSEPELLELKNEIQKIQSKY